ncbi:BsaA family SipW-dependent biofilm matrix protein [Enterococcus rivorum]|uniref:Alternate signal-mediated exported protein n=1 Tax=Enterococcus rivorum TaxID=762845 RepID=A0A1E5KYA9_9ENTE|nr:BsaA family SipW-dependent biofilm matrix protein [Enterococcus rivorum]MBP2099938.1 putative ribosomally synthesized peptide with SipW-like signal peptide [Enterococcus rivorum]OEH82845.1 hypothetical protein BCR26_11510 [Enterococcus rivorum]
MKKNNKKKILALASGFALVAVLAATFAWFTSKDEKTNHFEGEIATGKDIEVVETFEPPTTWEPGSEVNKDVAVANIGKYDTLVRVSLVESLELLEDYASKATTGTELNGKTKDDVYVLPGTAAPTGFTDSTFEGTAPQIVVTGGDFAGTYTLKVKEDSTTVNNKVVYTYRYVFEKNGGGLYYASGINGFERNAAGEIKVKAGTPSLEYVSLEYKTPETADWRNPVYNPTFTAGGTNIWNVFAKTGSNNIQISFNNITTTAGTPNKWYFNTKDGYFYYTGVVAPGANTVQLMDAVKLLGTAGNEYSKLKYDLTVKGEGISAFKDAVDEWVKPGTPGYNDELSIALKALVPEK